MKHSEDFKQDGEAVQVTREALTSGCRMSGLLRIWGLGSQHWANGCCDIGWQIWADLISAEYFQKRSFYAKCRILKEFLACIRNK
ncbi:MAG: hypothetical protein AABY88_10285 [Pseudomonadota bacterium]